MKYHNASITKKAELSFRTGIHRAVGYNRLERGTIETRVHLRKHDNLLALEGE